MVKLQILNKDNSFEKEIELDTKKSILDQMLDENVKIYYGCFGGSCGSCKCSIQEGKEFIEKEAIRPAIFKGLDSEDFLPCIAKIKTDSENKEEISKIPTFTINNKILLNFSRLISIHSFDYSFHSHLKRQSIQKNKIIIKKLL